MPEMERRSGLVFDVRGKHIKATQYYETEIAYDSRSSIDVYANLAFLYWKFATQLPVGGDPEIVAEEWSILGVKRFPLVLQAGLIVHPRSLELHFWRRYFPYAGVNEPFTREDCERLIATFSDDESLVPYFFLYLFDAVGYKEQRDMLWSECLSCPTAKNRHIMSLIARPVVLP